MIRESLSKFAKIKDKGVLIAERKSEKACAWGKVKNVPERKIIKQISRVWRTISVSATKKPNLERGKLKVVSRDFSLSHSK